jgi:hypothetical protein
MLNIFIEKSMRFPIITTALFSIFTLLASCNGESSDVTKEASIDSTVTATDSILIENNIPNIDTLKLDCTPNEAIEFMKMSSDWDKYTEGILPNLVEQHLPYAQRLINNQYDNFIIVDKNTMMVILYDKYGRRKLNFKMACGRNYGHKQKKADCRTPEGYFICGGWYNSTDWLYTDDNGYTSPIKGQFGPRFIRVTTQIGIHGTNARYSIGRRCSHGCIRIQNEEILFLHKYAKKGMPIIVNPGKKDNEENTKANITMPMLVLPDSIIENPKEFINFKNSHFKEKARLDSIERANSATDHINIDSLSIDLKNNNNHNIDSIKTTIPSDTIKNINSDSTILIP